MLLGDSHRAGVVGRVLSVVAVLAAFGLVFAGTASAKPKVKSKVHKGTLTVTGTNGDDTIVLRLGAGDPNDLEVDVGGDGTADASFNRADFDHIVVEAKKGDDTVSIDESNGVFTVTGVTTLDGGRGNDTLLGGSGAETFMGGGGNDFVDGNRGNDIAFLGAGDDTVQWDPGDGSDTVEGQSGKDALAFNGSNAAEKIDVTANGSRVRLHRDVAAIAMDLDDIESTDIRALGAADTITVDDLTGTGLEAANIDLAATTADGDGAADTVVVNGSDKAERVRVNRAGSQVLTTGLAARTTIAGSEAANDILRVNTLGGRDDVQVAPDVSTLITAVVDLGADQ
jgi:Ca2+-binding RTX toxin-like protein